MPSSPTLGFIGLGLMGKPMARHLIQAGFQSIALFNRHLHRGEKLVKHFARSASHMDLKARPWHESVIEAELENGTDGSTTAWYLFADPRQYDTIELGLLDGRDAPTVMELPQGDILGMTFLAYIDHEAKAIDWRSMYRNAGT